MANCIILNTGPSMSTMMSRSLGAYRVASALIEANYSTFVLDFVDRLSASEIIKVLEQHIGTETLWVGFSSTFFWAERKKYDSTVDMDTYHKSNMYWTTDYDEVLKIIKFIKKHDNVKLVYGGAKTPFALFDESIDYYVLGNADISTIELTDYLAGKIDAITHLEEVTINRHQRYKIDSFKYPEPQMNNVSTHWWNHEFKILQNEPLAIELARGCIFKCKFCNYPLLGKKKGTYLRDAYQIKDELVKTYETHGTTRYNFTDDTFNDDIDKIEMLHRVFTDLPFKLEFAAYLRIDLIHKYPEQAHLLSEMGLVGCYFGIETLQAESAKAIGKGLHPNKVKERLYWLSGQWKNKVNMSSGFILGLPYDTPEYFYELMAWSLELDNPLQEMLFFPLNLYNYKNPDLERYSSEFSINPEIYGYKFNNPEMINRWTLPSQKLSYNECLKLAGEFNELRTDINKIASFEIMNYLNLNIPLVDLHNLTKVQLYKKYDINAKAQHRLDEYKKIIL